MRIAALIVVLALAVAPSARANTFGHSVTATAAQYDYVPVPPAVLPLPPIDDITHTVSLPWTFPFYGIDRATLYVSDNGAARLTSGPDIPFQAQCLPSGLPGEPDLAVFWSDLNGTEGEIYTWLDTAEDRFIVSWEEMPLFGEELSGETVTFQLHLRPSGLIEYHYADLSFAFVADASNGVIGIQNTSATPDPLEFSCFSPQAIEAAAVVFSAGCTDDDGDGFAGAACGGDDCDDQDASVHPGAEESCDGIDQDCDGIEDGQDLDVSSISIGQSEAGGPIPDATTTTFTTTLSGGLALASMTLQINVDHPWVEDLTLSLTSPAGTTVLLADRVGGGGDDFAGTIFDDNADTAIAAGTPPFGGRHRPQGFLSDFAGEDTDGTWTLTIVDHAISDAGALIDWSPTFDLTTDGDNDGWVDGCEDCDPGDASINPAAAEICGDGIDQDCSGADDLQDADGDGHDAPACGGDDCDDSDAGVNPSVDADGDGVSNCEDCDDTNADNYPGHTETCGDGVDQDCSGADDGVDVDGDGHTAVVCGGEDCDDFDPELTPDDDEDDDGAHECVDCSDTDPDIRPGVTDICDGIDNDCTGEIDDRDFDGDGWTVCVDCSDIDRHIHPEAPEICGDGADEDCDGSDKEGDTDLDGFESVECGGEDCDDTDPDVNPDIVETCDPVDRDCDGSTGLVDADGDGFGDVACGGADCDDTRSTVHPGAPEICDTFDSDCDGSLRDDEVDLDGDGYGACNGECDDLDDEHHPAAPEQCNREDDDCDGLVDERIVVDADADGFASEECGGPDCDDADPRISPGVTEYCDGIDRDCSGVVDDPRVPCDQQSGCSVAPAASYAPWLLTPFLRRRRKGSRSTTKLGETGSTTEHHTP